MIEVFGFVVSVMATLVCVSMLVGLAGAMITAAVGGVQGRVEWTVWAVFVVLMALMALAAGLGAIEFWSDALAGSLRG